jgi:UDPglucose 6-dehydrogenase
MKLIVAGYGFVGKAVVNALETKHDMIIVDPKYTDTKISDHLDAEGLIICVDTPALDSGADDSSNIANVLDNTPIHIPVLIKSTVTPATIKALKDIYSEHWLCYSPEFLRAKTANQDFLNQKYMIIGGDDPECYWQTLFQESLPNCRMVFKCTDEESMLVKYASNGFLALKTSYFNHINDICLNTGMDFDVVRQLIAQDPRIGSDHTMVPGPDGSRGWGGHCFPKDTSALIKWAEAVNAPIGTLEKAVEYNHNIRKTIDNQ